MSDIPLWFLSGVLLLLFAAAAQRKWQRLSEHQRTATRTNRVWIALTIGLYVALIVARLLGGPLVGPHA